MIDVVIHKISAAQTLVFLIFFYKVAHIKSYNTK